MKMFQSAVFKLTAWYVGVLMIVSIAFSLPLYIMASGRLEHSALKQSELLRRNPTLRMMGMDRLDELNSLRQRQLDYDQSQLLDSILLENFIVLVFGAIASYLFAKWTLRPIEESHRAQSLFTANASHQLRTPLATMQAEIEVALRDKKLTSAESKQVLKSNLEEIARLRTLSDQLLKLTSTSGLVTGKKFDMSKLVYKFVSVNKTKYKLELDPHSYVDKKLLMVEGEPGMISEALAILCDNASKYSAGKPVVLKMSSRNGEVCVVVKDSGVGISKQDQLLVFDRFYRGSKADELHPSGHGLGLALVKEIVERHNGEVTLKSQLGEGSEFGFVLPVV